MNYAIEHNGKAFLPDGQANDIADVSAHNSQLEQAEIAWLRTAPEKCFLYVKRPSADAVGAENCKTKITTFLGTTVSDKDSVSFSVRRYMGFGFNSYRRSITAQIFGTLYHGWYYESSGDYCRLRKAKKQGKENSK